MEIETVDLISRLAADFSVHLVPARPEGNQQTTELLYNEAFEFWFTTWSAALKELGQHALTSDDFSRQDEILVLHYRGAVAATAFFRFADLSRSIYRKDSYFSVWPDCAFKLLTREGFEAIICSYFTVGDQYRRGTLGVSVKDVLLGLLVERFLSSSRAVMTGTVRNNRGVNKCCLRFGATPILENQTLHGVDVDLLGFYRGSVHKAAEADIRFLVEDIWRRFRDSTASWHPSGRGMWL